MHKVARHNGHIHHRKHPHTKKHSLKKIKYVMPLLLAQYKKVKSKPFISMGITLGIGLGILSTVLIWLNVKK